VRMAGVVNRQYIKTPWPLHFLTVFLYCFCVRQFLAFAAGYTSNNNNSSSSNNNHRVNIVVVVLMSRDKRFMAKLP